MNIEQLIHSAREGDEAAFGRLLESFRSSLRILARIGIGRQLRGKVDESDVVQETFLDAHRYFPSFRGQSEAQFAEWLRGILSGVVGNTVRRYVGTRARDVRREAPLPGEAGSQASFGPAPLPGNHTSPSQKAIRVESTLEIIQAVARLPEDYREVIVLRHVDGLPFAQVAEQMGRSVDSVEKLWVRAVARLRQNLGSGTP